MKIDKYIQSVKEVRDAAMEILSDEYLANVRKLVEDCDKHIAEIEKNRGHYAVIEKLANVKRVLR